MIVTYTCRLVPTILFLSTNHEPPIVNRVATVFREKAPFMLVVEVLSAEGEEDGEDAHEQLGEERAAAALGDNPLDKRSESHASAGPGLCLAV